MYDYDKLLAKIPNKYMLAIEAGSRLADRQSHLSELEQFEPLSVSIKTVLTSIKGE